MTEWNEPKAGSLSFKDRSLSKAAAGQLLDVNAGNTLGQLIDTAVTRIKLAKTAKAEEATDAQFARRHPSGRFSTIRKFGRATTRESA